MISENPFHSRIQIGFSLYIRADVIDQGTDQVWIKYNPIIHGYIMFGNFLDRSCSHGIFVKITNEDVSFLNDEFVRLGKETDELYYFCNKDAINTTRTDVNPGKIGNSHYESRWNCVHHPTLISLKYWPDDSDFNIKNIEQDDNLINLAHPREC